MATATVVKAWRDASMAYLAGQVSEGGTTGSVEYMASTPLLDVHGLAKTADQLKADLVAALQVQRNAQQGTAPVMLAITGKVTV